MNPIGLTTTNTARTFNMLRAMMKILFVLLVGCTVLWFIVMGISAIGTGQNLWEALGLIFGVPAVFWIVYGAMAWACNIVDKPPRE